MIVVIGEVLFDMFPEHKRIGGAPFNFAFHLSQLGLPVTLVTRVGDDADGREIMDTMRRFGVSTDGVQVDPAKDTGKVQVSLDDAGVPEYEIVQDVAYDHIVYTEAVRERIKTAPQLVYFGTLIQRGGHGWQMMEQVFADRHPETLFFYDVNLRPDGYKPAVIQNALSVVDILKLNDEELRMIGNMLGYTGDSAAVISALFSQYNFELVAVTQGAAGSTIYTRENTVSCDIADSDYHCVDTVGAGDGFAAALAAGYLRQMPIQDILDAATDFAGKICGIAGAVPDRADFYQSLKKQIV